MPATTQPNSISDFVKLEFNPSFNREKVTLISGQNLAVGTVLGKITASGKYMAYDPAATGGTAGAENACAVLLDTTNASDGDVACTVLARGPAIIADKSQLIWGSGVTTDGHKNTAIAALAALGMVARRSQY